MSKLQLGVNSYITNNEYHADRNYYSSSDFKLILKSAQSFYKEKILGIKEEKKENPAFLEGSFLHSLILEPDRIEQEYAFFEQWRKQGKEWEAFKAVNPGKTILSKPQKFRCERYLAAYEARPEAKQLLTGGFAEHTLCIDLDGIPVKIRTDYINIAAGYVLDVKTTGYASGVEVFKGTINEFGYDLSAALYTQVAERVYGKPFAFYFVVISKQDFECNVYKAGRHTLINGQVNLARAIEKYKLCKTLDSWIDDNVSLESEADYIIEEV